MLQLKVNSVAASQLCVVVGYAGGFWQMNVCLRLCVLSDFWNLRTALLSSVTDASRLIEQADHSNVDRPWTELSLWLTVMIGGGNGCVQDCGEDEGHIGPI